MKKLTPDAARLIEFMPEAVNLLAQKLASSFDKTILYGDPHISTNVDMVREMSTEALSAFFTQIGGCCMPRKCPNPDAGLNRCTTCWLKWLLSEVINDEQ